MDKALKDKRVRILKFIEYYDDSFHDDERTMHVSHDIICVFEEFLPQTLFSNCQNAIMLGNDKVVNDAMKILPRHIKNSFENKYLVLHFSYSYCDIDFFNCEKKVTYDRYKYVRTPYKIFIPKSIIITDLVEIDDMKLYTKTKIMPCKKYSFDCNCSIHFPFFNKLEENKKSSPSHCGKQFLEWNWK